MIFIVYDVTDAQHTLYRHVTNVASVQILTCVCIVTRTIVILQGNFKISYLTQRHIQNPVKHLRWNVFRKQLMTFLSYDLFSELMRANIQAYLIQANLYFLCLKLALR